MNCRHCRHSKREWDSGGAEGKKSALVCRNPANAQWFDEWDHCSVARESGFCGREARYFAPRWYYRLFTLGRG